MIATKDVARLMRPRPSNLILTIPVFTVILPTVLRYPMQVPTWLMLPHIIYLAMFTASMLAAIPKAAKNMRQTLNPLHNLEKTTHGQILTKVVNRAGVS